MMQSRLWFTVADPDLELRGRGGGGGGFDLLALSAIFPSVISSFFTQNKGEGGGAGPSPRSATGLSALFLISRLDSRVLDDNGTLFGNNDKLHRVDI